MAEKPEEQYTPNPYVLPDVVAPCAKPGCKAGNSLLDDVLEQIRNDSIIKRLKSFYKILKGK